MATFEKVEPRRLGPVILRRRVEVRLKRALSMLLVPDTGIYRLQRVVDLLDEFVFRPVTDPRLDELDR